MYIQNTEILLHLQTVPDQTGRQDREKGTGTGGECAACRRGAGLLPAYIYRRELDSRTHRRGRGQRRVPVLAVCGWQGARSLCLPDPVPWSLVLQASAQRGFWVGTSGPRGREVIAPWSLLWKTEACLVCPSSCLWLAWSILPPSPAHPEAHWAPRRIGAAARFQASLGSGRRTDGAAGLLLFLSPS